MKNPNPPGCAAGGGLDNDGPAGAGASSDFPVSSFLRWSGLFTQNCEIKYKKPNPRKM
jgi:hypothetical protein